MQYPQVKASFTVGQQKLYKKMPSLSREGNFFAIKRSFLHATALLCRQTFW